MVDFQSSKIIVWLAFPNLGYVQNSWGAEGSVLYLLKKLLSVPSFFWQGLY